VNRAHSEAHGVGERDGEIFLTADVHPRTGDGVRVMFASLATFRGPIPRLHMGSPFSKSDEALMARAGRGDGVAYAALFERHFDRVRALARRMLGRDDEIDDVAQEVFLRVWSAAPAWRPQAAFTTWLRRVACHVCLDRITKKREVPCERTPEIEDSSHEPSRRAYARQLEDHLRRALEALPETQRRAFVLCHYQGMRRREVAAVMGLSTLALESLVARARKSMRLRMRRIEGYGRPSDPGRRT
jgi:RNA polymerase sigma-70 factor, ECF subfamily